MLVLKTPLPIRLYKDTRKSCRGFDTTTKGGGEKVRAVFGPQSSRRIFCPNDEDSNILNSKNNR